MATKIRLQRHGKKNKPFYHIVIADSRSKRDGKFIEKIGTYNPNVNPHLIDLNFERALHWYGTGAEPTDTMRTILSSTGVLYKSHLERGIKKGALTQAEADKKFAAWVQEKENKNLSASDKLKAEKEAARQAALATEKEVNEKRAAMIAAKNAPEEVAEEPEAVATESTEEETPSEDTAAE